MERDTYNSVKELCNNRDFDKAFLLLKQIAEEGDSEAMFELAVMYEFVYTNSEKAVEWYEKAVYAGFAKAMYNLGLLYEFAEDFDKAKLAAEYKARYKDVNYEDFVIL